MEKWALAMEGGSLRCMFSAGAVDVMMERQLWANGVFGVSAGALTGVNYGLPAGGAHRPGEPGFRQRQAVPGAGKFNL